MARRGIVEREKSWKGRFEERMEKGVMVYRIYIWVKWRMCLPGKESVNWWKL